MLKLSKHAKFYKLEKNIFVVYNNLIFEPILLNYEEYIKIKNGQGNKLFKLLE